LIRSEKGEEVFLLAVQVEKGIQTANVPYERTSPIALQ
jgi:hypothetical protein